MVQSITVIGGTSSGHLTGLVPVPLDNTSPPGFVNSLQTLLGSNINGTGYSDSVNAGALFLSNLNVAGINGAVAFGANNSGVPGILELTNTDSNGSVHSGSANIVGAVPSNYSTFIVQVPGDATISGNGSNNQLDIFGANSSVNFNTGGGSGTVVAGGGGDFIIASGSTWSVLGSTDGNDTVAVAVGGSATVSTYGQGLALNNAIGADTVPSNVVGLNAGNVTVISGGTNDLVESFVGSDVVSVNNSANVLVSGGAATVYADVGSTAVKAFFQVGGTLDFINNSGSAATVSGDVPGATGGSATIFGGAGGGVYIGGSGGNNSILSGSGNGLSTVVGAGSNNFLSVGGYGTVNAANLLNAGSGGATMVAGSTTDVNQFYGGTGTDSIVSFGQGSQVYFVGSQGTENITGSTVTGASNHYYLSSASGSREDVISNFSVSRDSLTVTAAGDTITGVFSASGGALVQLADNTLIQLVGVSASSLTSLVGGSYI